MQDLEQALSLIAEHPGEASFVGKRAELVVRSAEKALGFKLPPTYRRFLSELGAGSFGASEFFGVIDIDFEKSSAPDAIWSTLRARDRNDLPLDLVVIGRENDVITCLQIKPEAAEGPLLEINAGEDPDRVGTHTCADDFGAYLLSRVQEELEALS